MKVVIAGSRYVSDIRIVRWAIRQSRYEITQVISGKEPTGVDRLGEIWADENGIDIDPHPAKWRKFGKGAGNLRNAEMAKIADALIAVWVNKSPGTANMISYMKLLGKPWYAVELKVGRYQEIVDSKYRESRSKGYGQYELFRRDS